MRACPCLSMMALSIVIWVELTHTNAASASIQLEIDNGIAKFTHSSILSWLVLVVGRQQVVFWKAESKLYRLVVVSRPNIDSLSIDLTKSTPTIWISSPKSKSNPNFQQENNKRTTIQIVISSAIDSTIITARPRYRSHSPNTLLLCVRFSYGMSSCCIVTRSCCCIITARPPYRSDSRNTLPLMQRHQWWVGMSKIQEDTMTSRRRTWWVRWSG